MATFAPWWEVRYSDDQPRDDHGRWSGDGATLGSRAPSSTITDTDAGKMQQALDDAVSRHPELADAVDVRFTSAATDHTEPLYKLVKDEPQLAAATTDEKYAQGDGKIETMVNDDLTADQRYAKAGFSGEAARTPYGMLTHEMGHAYLMAHGYGDLSDATLLESHDLDPQTVSESLGAKYTESDASEALAEMYATQHTPGFTLPPSIAEKYAAVEAQIAAQPTIGKTRSAWQWWETRYSDDQPRDDHGRWSGSGGGAGSSLTIGPVHGSITEKQHGEIQHAVDDAIARSPELLTGDRPLTSVSFLSQAAPGDKLAEHMREVGAQASTVVKPTEPMRIMVDDNAHLEPWNTKEAGETPYGLVTHELGHAYFSEHGVLLEGDAIDALSDHSIMPEDAANISRYAASSPGEALAEMYAQTHTPGFSLPPSLAANYQDLENEVRSHGPVSPADYEAKVRQAESEMRPRLGPDSPLMPALLKAAAENLKANEWIAGKVENGLDIRELRFSDDQPRDDHGRWTSGGNVGTVIDAANQGGGTIDPKTGEEATTGYAVAYPERSEIVPDAKFLDDEKNAIAVTKAWLAKNADVFKEPGVHIGVWHDVAHNEVVLDPSQVVADRDQAIQLGIDRNQQSIYHLDSGQEIPTGGTGDRKQLQASTYHDQADQAGQRDDGRRAGGASAGRGHGGEKEQVAPLELWWEPRYSDDQPRDDHGRWSGSGGGSVPDLSSTVYALKLGHHTSTDAQNVREVVREAAATGSTVNLANLHVDGADHGNLFDYSATSLDRAEMPQIGDAKMVQAFSEKLGENGIDAQLEKVSPTALYATQDELDAKKVDGIATWAEEKPEEIGKAAIVVSKDGAVLDGTHRWAGASVYAITHSDFQITALRANADIDTLLKLGNDFDVEHGIAHQGIGTAALAGNAIK